MLTSRACTRVLRDVRPGDTAAVPVITVRHGERVAVRRRHQAPSAGSQPVTGFGARSQACGTTGKNP